MAGERRLRACQSLGWAKVPVRIVSIDAIAFGEHDENEIRKDFTPSERVAIGQAVEAALGNRRGRRTDLLPQNFAEVSGKETSDVAAEKAGFGNRETYKQAKKVVATGAPELVAAMDDGKVSVSAAADVATLPQQQQREIVAQGEREILEAAKRIRAERAEARRAELAAVASVEAQMPEGKFGTIVIDPPWPMQKIERDARPNQVAFEYPTMSEDELIAFGDRVNDAAADDCHLFMWTTQKFLPMSLRLLDAWGFRYVLTMVWHKPGGFQPVGLPQFNCEFCVYARRGSPKFVETKQFSSCFEAPRREHSRKPDEFYDIVRRVTAGPRIDVFSREAREGFAQFGNELQRFEGAA